jgi:Uma2 family endonuclease
MYTEATKPGLLPRDYLALERQSPTRNEYWEERIIPKAPSSRGHSLIVVNTIAEIGRQIEDRPCEVYAINMRVGVSATGAFTYPDVVVVREPEFLDRQRDTLLNPTVIFEVLSESTEAYDRVKFGQYRRIPSLREYVMVSQDRMLVERYIRQGENWVLSDYSLPEHVLRLDSIDCAIPLDRIYVKVTFDAKHEAAVGHPR